MVRSYCIGPVVVALAWTGLAWGQDMSRGPSSADPTVNSQQRVGMRHPVITVQEQDKPGERCRILKAWVMVDGSRAYQAQNVATQEMLTIVETGPRSSAQSQEGHCFQAVATRIYHWGRGDTPPEGAPVPPPSEPVVRAQPVPTPSISQVSAPPVLPPSVPVVSEQPATPVVVAPSDQGQVSQPLSTPRLSGPVLQAEISSAAGSKRVWPAAYADRSSQSPAGATAYAATNLASTSPEKCNAAASLPCAVVQDTAAMAVPVFEAPATPKPVPVVRVPNVSLQDIPVAQVVEVPATSTASTAALAGQTPTLSTPNSPYAMRSTPDQATVEQSKPAHLGGLLVHLFSSDDATSSGKHGTIVAQAGPVANELATLPKATVKDVPDSSVVKAAPSRNETASLPKAKVKDMAASPVVQVQATTPALTDGATLPFSSSTPPVQVKSSTPAVLPTFPTNLKAPPDPAPSSKIADPSSTLALPNLPKLLKDSAPDMPSPLMQQTTTTTQLPLAKVTPLTPVPSPAPTKDLLPLAIVRPLSKAKPSGKSPAAPAPKPAGKNPPAPLKTPVADSSKPDPFDNLGTYVKVQGQDVDVKAPEPGKGISGTSAITPVGAVSQPTPANSSSSGGAGAGQSGSAASTTPGSVSAPPGRQSVVAAQTAATQTSVEMKMPGAKTPNTMLTGASVVSQEGNAFSAPKGPPAADDPRANAWTAPANQMVQAPPGSMGSMPGYPPGSGGMMPPSQPLMPPPGPPMMLPAMPYQGAAAPAMCQPPMPCAQPHCPVPCGYSNAFTQAGNPNPIPADMGHDPTNTDNAFQSISCATPAVPPTNVCGFPACPGPSYPPPAMAMAQPGMVPAGAMLPPRMPYAYQAMPAAPPMGMMANPGLAPVRVSGEQMAQAQPLTAPTPAAPAAGNPLQRVGAQVAMPASMPGLSETATMPELMGVLNDSLYPSQRERAAEGLTRFDWRVHPQIVEGLLLAAKNDPAPMVRIACIHSLVQLKAGTTYVAKGLLEIKETDRDTRVRQEAEQSLHVFIPGGAAASR